jgi:Peptidase propeptide and YPEB domain
MEHTMSPLSIAFALASALALASASVVIAQTTPPSSTDTKAPVPGANSFTEEQAKDRIEKAGFTQVSGLRKDDQGIWRASAKQGDKQVNVSLDFRGNVTAQ